MPHPIVQRIRLPGARLAAALATAVLAGGGPAHGVDEAEMAAARQEDGAAAADAAVRSAIRRLEAGAIDDAIEDLERATRLAPGSAEIWALLGRARSRRRDFGGAEAAFTRAVELGDSSMRTRYYLGAVLWEQGRLEEAETAYRGALEAPGDPTQVQAQLGRLLLWQGRFEEAVGPLRSAAAGAPAAVEVLFDLAEALRGADLDEEAIRVYRRVTELAPDLLKARYGLAILLAASGDRAASDREFAAYTALYEQDQERTRTAERREGELHRAAELIESGDPARAVELLSARPDSIDALMLLATAYDRLGRPDEATAALERAVVLDPSRADVRRALAERRARASQEGTP